MTRLSSSPGMVALVQTAMMLPLVVVSLPAGAVADMYDKRKVAMSGLACSSFFAAILAGAPDGAGPASDVRPRTGAQAVTLTAVVP